MLFLIVEWHQRGMAMYDVVFRTALTGATIGVVVAIGATSSEAGKKAKPEIAALEMTGSQFRRSVFSGNEARIAQFWTVNADCSSGPLVDVRVVKSPSNGQVSFQEVRSIVELKKEHQRAHCNEKPVDAVGMFYTSREDFTGTDKMQIEVDYKSGFVRRYSIIVDVR